MKLLFTTPAVGWLAGWSRYWSDPALVLSLATRQIADINSFHWNGFVPANIALFSSTKIKNPNVNHLFTG
jgi:hypothetical protein